MIAAPSHTGPRVSRVRVSLQHCQCRLISSPPSCMIPKAPLSALKRQCKARRGLWLDPRRYGTCHSGHAMQAGVKLKAPREFSPGRPTCHSSAHCRSIQRLHRSHHVDRCPLIERGRGRIHDGRYYTSSAAFTTVGITSLSVFSSAAS